MDNHLEYCQISDLYSRRNGYEVIAYFIDNYVAHHPSKQLILCELSRLYVVIIANYSCDPIAKELLHLLQTKYGWDCLEQHGAVIGGFIMCGESPSLGSKYVELIDTTIRGLNLARKLLSHDSSICFIPRHIIASSSLFWFKCFKDQDLDALLRTHGINRECLNWYHLDNVK